MALFYSHESSHRHDTGAHPENAARLRAIEAALAQTGGAGIKRVEAPAATREQIVRVHTDDHYAGIERICNEGGGMIDMDTITSPDSLHDSWKSAVAVCAAS